MRKGKASEDSDNELMPLAFHVEGELPPETGPPTNGEEYLMRVRWEAKRCEQTVVSNIDPRKYDANVSSSWFPPRCLDPPPGLEPSSTWQTSFLKDFQKLQQQMEQLYQQKGGASSSESFPPIDDSDEWYEFCLGGENRAFAHLPLLHTILCLQPIDIYTLIQYHIDWIEDELDEVQAKWLFALLTRLDKPIDADIAASLRVLLRKACEIRSKLTIRDSKEAASLNILIVLVAKYFGQQDRD